VEGAYCARDRENKCTAFLRDTPGALNVSHRNHTATHTKAQLRIVKTPLLVGFVLTLEFELLDNSQVDFVPCAMTRTCTPNLLRSHMATFHVFA